MEEQNTGRRYLVYGHYGGCNTGDEAMLWCLLERLVPLRGVSICLVTKGETEAGRFPKTECLSTSPLDLLKGAIWCDELILGGGTHFHDDYKPVRYLRHFAYMLRIVMLAGLVKLRGKKLRLIGMGFGPFNRHSGRIVTSMALALADTVTTRDAGSSRAARLCLNNVSVIDSFDTAALLEPGEKRARRPGLIGISVAFSQTYELEGAEAGEWWKHFGETLATVARTHSSVRFRILILRGGSREDDQLLSAELRDRLKDELGEDRVEWCPYDPDPRRMLTELAECEGIIATRYHAALMGYASGCRLLFLPYHKKLTDLAEEIGLPDSGCFEFRRRAAWDALGDRLDSFLSCEGAGNAAWPVPEAHRKAEKSFLWLPVDPEGEGDGRKD